MTSRISRVGGWLVVLPCGMCNAQSQKAAQNQNPAVETQACGEFAARTPAGAGVRCYGLNHIPEAHRGASAHVCRGGGPRSRGIGRGIAEGGATDAPPARHRVAAPTPPTACRTLTPSGCGRHGHHGGRGTQRAARSAARTARFQAHPRDCPGFRAPSHSPFLIQSYKCQSGGLNTVVRNQCTALHGVPHQGRRRVGRHRLLGRGGDRPAHVRPSVRCRHRGRRRPPVPTDRFCQTAHAPEYVP